MLAGLASCAGALVTGAISALAALLVLSAALTWPARSRHRLRPRVSGARLFARLARYGARLPRAGSNELTNAIARAGLTGIVTPRDLLGARVATGFLGVLFAPSLIGSGPGNTGLAIALIVPIAAIFAPDLWLRRRSAIRGAQIERELPELLDLLRASVSAGLPLEHATRMVSRFMRGPLAQELATVAAETSFGIPRMTALDGMAARAPLPGVRALVTALHRAEREGASLSQALSAQAQDARSAANRRIAEAAGRAGPQIQLIVSMVIVPAAMLLLGSAVVAAIADGRMKLI